MCVIMSPPPPPPSDMIDGHMLYYLMRQITPGQEEGMYVTVSVEIFTWW